MIGITKFKVGQTVELIDNHCMAASVGATAIIYGISMGLIDVTWKTKSKGQLDGGYYPKYFKPTFKKGEQLYFNYSE